MSDQATADPPKKRAVYEASIKKLEAKALRENLILTIAGFNELLIDLDKTDDLAPFVEKLRLVHRIYKPVLAAHKRRSRSGTGWHIRVIMSVTLEPRERCALHLAVGSDPVRELLRMRSIRDGTEDQDSCFLDDPKFVEEPLEWNK